MAKERLSLYFDTDIPSESKMWAYICKDGKNRKSRNVKIALEMFLDGVSIEPGFEQPKVDKVEKKEENIYEAEIIETNDEDDIDLEDIPF